MPILNRIKTFFSQKKLSKKHVYWVIPLAILLILLLFRACSNHHIERKSVYYIGRDSTWQIELLGRDRSLIAFTNELIAIVGKENDLRFEWVETNPNHLLKGLDNLSYDFILTTLRPNVVNQEQYDFSELLFDLGPVLIVREDSELSSLKEMQGKLIGIPYGLSTNFNAVRAPGFNIYDLSLVYYNNINEALDALINDAIDGVIMKAIPAYALTHGLYATKLKVVTSPLNDEGLRIVSLKSSSLEDIIEIINDSLDAIRKDGTYRSFINKWNLIDAQTEFWQPHEESQP